MNSKLLKIYSNQLVPLPLQLCELWCLYGSGERYKCDQEMSYINYLSWGLFSPLVWLSWGFSNDDGVLCVCKRLFPLNSRSHQILTKRLRTRFNRTDFFLLLLLDFGLVSRASPNDFQQEAGSLSLRVTKKFLEENRSLSYVILFSK